MPPSTTPAAGVRARVRAELTREILDSGRRMLASDGAAGLSLRAVARELGMASSAVYRYFPSRDDLLTALVIEAYDAVGGAAEQADAALPREDLRGRWRAICTGVRRWALAHPHEYALIYGSPVPGYAAPQATTAAASRMAVTLLRVAADGIESGVVPVPDDPAGPAVAADVLRRTGLPESLPAGRAVAVWSGLFGLITFELFGHTAGVVEDHEAFFAASTDRLGDELGIPR